MSSRYFQIGEIWHKGEEGIFRASPRQIGWRSLSGGDTPDIIIDVDTLDTACFDLEGSTLQITTRERTNPYFPILHGRNRPRPPLPFENFTAENIEDIAFAFSQWYKIQIRNVDYFSNPSLRGGSSWYCGGSACTTDSIETCYSPTVVREGWVYKRSRYLRVWRQRWYVNFMNLRGD